MVAPVDGIQDPYLSILYLYASEHLYLYNKAIVRLPESYRYGLTRSKWADFYQELEDSVSKFVFKAEVLVLNARYGLHVPLKLRTSSFTTHLSLLKITVF